MMHTFKLLDPIMSWNQFSWTFSWRSAIRRFTFRSHQWTQRGPWAHIHQWILTSFVPSDTTKENWSAYFSSSLVWTYWMLRDARSACVKVLILVPEDEERSKSNPFISFIGNGNWRALKKQRPVKQFKKQNYHSLSYLTFSVFLYSTFVFFTN